ALGRGPAPLWTPPGDALAPPASVPHRRLDSPDVRPGGQPVARGSGRHRSLGQMPSVAGTPPRHDQGPQAGTSPRCPGRFLVARRVAGCGAIRPVTTLAAVGARGLAAPGLLGTPSRE